MKDSSPCVSEGGLHLEQKWQRVGGPLFRESMLHEEGRRREVLTGWVLFTQ